MLAQFGQMRGRLGQVRGRLGQMRGSGGGGGGGWGGGGNGGANRRRVAIGLDADDADDGFIEGARDGARAVLGRRGDTLVD